MVFDFAAQPPELISAKIYSGPGTESLQAAAAAWDGLAGELQSTAANFQSVIAGLVSGDWTGPSSEAAAAAAAPYVSWLSTTAGQAEQTAGQARAAASAYETALAATVPPAEIAANRTQLLSLLQSNILGQNNAAIAALEAEYAQFWAQDVAAITGYAGSSQAATTGWAHSPRRRKPPTPAAPATQSAAVAAASTTSGTYRSGIDHRADRGRPATNFLTDVGQFNSDYTNFFTSSFNSIPGGSYLSTTWTNLSSMISGAGSQATWTNVVNSTTGLGISQWKNFFIYQPWSHGVALGSLERRAVVAGARRRPGTSGRERHRRRWAARRRWASCRCRPAGPAPLRRSGLPLRRCRTALSPRRRLPRWIFRSARSTRPRWAAPPEVRWAARPPASSAQRASGPK